jgi:hypothetical protein
LVKATADPDAAPSTLNWIDPVAKACPEEFTVAVNVSLAPLAGAKLVALNDVVVATCEG